MQDTNMQSVSSYTPSTTRTLIDQCLQTTAIRSIATAALNMIGTTVTHMKKNIRRLLVHLQGLLHISLQQRRSTMVLLPQDHLGDGDILLHLGLHLGQVTLVAQDQGDLQYIGEMRMYVSAKPFLRIMLYTTNRSRCKGSTAISPTPEWARRKKSRGAWNFREILI